MAAVANGRFIGGGIPISPASELADGLFDLVSVASVPRWKIPFYLPGLMMKKVLNFRITEHLRCRRVRIQSPGMRVQIDGEIVSMDEALLEIRPGALELFSPPA